jgi:S-adenosylmethionine decarboxylase
VGENYTSPPIGQEISCVMHGIEKILINDNDKIESIVLDSLNKNKFGILDVQKHYFNPHGFTMMVLLSESHLAIHTYPEYNSIYFNMYSCRGPEDAEKTFAIFRKNINPKKIIFQKNNKVPVKLF